MNIAHARVFAAASAILPVLGLYGGRIALPMIIIFGLAAIWAERGISISRNIAYALLLMVGLPLLSCMWSLDPLKSYESWLRVAALMLLGGCVFDWMQQTKAEAADRMSHWFMSGMAVASVLLYLETIESVAPAAHILADYYKGEFTLAYFNRGVGVLALMVWPAVLALHRDGRNKAAAFLPLFLLPLFGQFDSMSAGLALLAGLLVYYIASSWPKSVAAIMTYLLPMLVVSLPLWLPLLLDYVIQFKASLPESARHRIMIWNFAVERGMEHPLLGWGFDTSRIMPGGNESLQYRRPLLPLHPHNMVLQLFLEIGWAGVMSFAVAWGMLARKICNLAEASEKPVFWAAMTAWLAIAVTGYGMWQYWWLAISWWLAAVMGHMLRNSTK